MKKFKVGCYYVMRSPCDHECIWVYKVISRTAKTITLCDGETTARFRISKASEEFGREAVYPEGHYGITSIEDCMEVVDEYTTYINDCF